MTSKACVDSARARNSGPLTPSGIRLARVLGQLKSVSDPRTSPVYAAPAAEGDEMPSENHQNLHTRSAFEAILAPHMGELHGAAMRLSRSPSDADDVLQEAMARAWMFWDRFEPGTNVRAWMHRILYNTFVNGYRRRRREREVLEQVHEDECALRDDTTDVHILEDGLGDEVRTALSSLPETFREVVERVDLHGDSYRDAADAIGCPVGTIMSRLHRGRRLLKEQLRGYATSEGYVQAA